jgi:hypothetical protein
MLLAMNARVFRDDAVLPSGVGTWANWLPMPHVVENVAAGSRCTGSRLPPPLPPAALLTGGRPDGLALAMMSAAWVGGR